MHGHENELIVRQLSGLGNQMFQYAAGLYYSRRYRARMSMATDPPEYALSHGQYPRPFLLSHFQISANHRELTSFERFLMYGNHRYFKAVSKPLLQHALRVQILAEAIDRRFHFQPELPIVTRSRRVYLLGYWQVYEIADRMSADLRKEFSLRDAPTGINLEVLRQIKGIENSVSIHIRRGDYTLQAEGNVALPMTYYVRAISRLREQVSNPTFFVFSDDMEFARRSLGGAVSAVFVDHNDSMSAHEDLRLMSSCRHQIIANSTFSWWAAWLCSALDKIVIAPRNWMVGGRPNYDGLFPPTWTLL